MSKPVALTVSSPNPSMYTVAPLLSVKGLGLIQVVVVPNWASNPSKPQRASPVTLMYESVEAVPVVNCKALDLGS